MVNWIFSDLGTCSLDETRDAYNHYHIGTVLVDIRDIPDGKTKGKEFERLKKHLLTIVALRSRGCRVIIRCHAGISRSNGMAIGVIMLQHKIAYEDARKLVLKFIPQANPHPDFMDDIQKAVNELSIR